MTQWFWEAAPEPFFYNMYYLLYKLNKLMRYMKISHIISDQLFHKLKQQTSTLFFYQIL